MPHYLFGPIGGSFAQQHLHTPRNCGECLTFGPTEGVDLVLGHTASWADIQERLPVGWVPDFVALNLASYLALPASAWTAPVPLVALAGDWNLLWHAYRHQLPRCERILTDTLGVEMLSRQGLSQVRQANLYGCGGQWEAIPPENVRDIDLLFVGSLRSAIHRTRLPWLARLAALSQRYRVVIAAGVFGEDYRRLLGRARIVFNHSVRSECNQRVFEAIASGALLFQEADNREVPELLRDREEYVAYRDDDLESLLAYYLDHEDERCKLAQTAQARLPEFTFAYLWERQVELLAQELPDLQERARQRVQVEPEQHLHQRLWQLLHCPAGSDPTLASDFHKALLSQPRSAGLTNALALTLHREAGLTTPSPAAETPLTLWRRAWLANPTQPVIGFNLTFAWAEAGNSSEAVAQARCTLASLDGGSAVGDGFESVPVFSQDFDHLRVEWERAAWEHAGNPVGEEEAKRSLLRWRLHALLGKHTGHLTHFYEAMRCRPDLPPAQAALGHALLHADQAAEALPYLRQALASNPFEPAVAQMLYQALTAASGWREQHRLAHERQLLHRAAPEIVPAESWFPDGPATPLEATLTEEPVRVVWEGGFHTLHSLSMVNRALCGQLLALHQEVSLVATGSPQTPDKAEPLSPDLLARFNQERAAPVEVHVRHTWPPRWTPPPTGRWVVMQHWEFGSLPRDWVRPLAQEVDEVWVLSAFARRCFVESGVPAERVQVIPGGVDVAALTSPQPPFPLKTEKGFRFLFVGGTLPRKGIDLLLAAFARTFRRQDDVCLVIKDMGTGSFYQGQTAGELVARHQADPDAPAVEYLDRTLTTAELASLYQSCHCLVHPYRGEGFGLPVAEAMACGLPVIVTGYGAALDFCTEDTAFLLPAQVRHLTEKRVGDLETVGLPWLAEPNLDMLCYELRYVVEHPEEARRKGQAAATHIAANFRWEQAAERVLERLRYLRSQPIRREQRVPVSAPLPVASPGETLAQVCLCMIVKNEEDNLARCLTSVADLVANMVIADTGSTDRTKEIAAQFGAKVIDFVWQDSFAAARNESLRHATGDWILWLDGDEYFDADNRERLRTLFGRLGKENVGYTMRQHSALEGPGQASVVDQMRLFPRHPDLRWSYRVHEQILPSLSALGASVSPTNVVICHTGYTIPAMQGPKVERNLRLLQLDLQEHPDDYFILYNLGSVALTQRRFAEALQWLRRSMERCHPRDTVVRKLYALQARCYEQMGQTHEALAMLRTGQAAFPEDGELMFWEAAIRRGQNDFAGAERSLVRLLQTPATACFTSGDAGLHSYRAQNLLGEVLKLQGRVQEAEQQWRAALTACPDLVEVWWELAKLYFEQGRWDDLDRTAEHLQGNPSLAVEATMYRARGLLERQQFAAAREGFQRVIAARPQVAYPRLLLAYTYLQERTNLAAAEQPLRDVLALDPTHKEARHNLTLLLRVLGRPEAVQRVSITIIAKNEEANLPGCLQTLRGLDAELIVADTGSTDRTKEIAASFGAKVVDFPWQDSFAAARNEAIRHASGAWIFWMDADDRLTEDNRDKLKQLFASLKDEGAAYVMKCLCLPNGKGESDVVDHLRLFRNHPDLRWSYRVHEQILPAVRRLGHAVRWADIVIHHTGYQDASVRDRKEQRNQRLLRMELAERPDDAFTLFNLGSSLQLEGRLQEALELFRRSLARSAPSDSIVRKLYTLMCQCWRRLGKVQEALTVCREGRSICPDDLELLYQEGHVRKSSGDNAGAVVCWEECLRMPPGQYFGSYDPGLRGHITRHHLGMAYRDLGRLADAEARWRAVLAERADYQPSWRELAHLLNEQERWIEAKELSQAAAAGSPGPLLGACLRCRTHLARKNFAEARKRATETIASWPWAAEPRQLLSYALIQEGKDWSLAEQSLRDVLGVDPGNDEARSNLAVMLRQQGRWCDGAIAPELTLADLYRTECRKGTKLQEHLPTIYLLARSCQRVTELGVRTPGITTTLLFAQPEKLTCYDRVRPSEVGLVAGLAQATHFVFQEADVLTAEIEETDLLLLDTDTRDEPFRKALRSQASKVRKNIVFCATAAMGSGSENGNDGGMWQAVEELLTQGDFRLRQGQDKHAELAVLERV